ncbi:C4-dicarboxylate TRAP transporter substrate-binding protein [Polymorphum gilvum]|uniref:TRAP-type C4-dicarboxylate transport system periplasmic component-like protein n=1 Tax=Polymorphum gilvum (strain LMG 25793 / CGMCC 1.9160 / SL003B-26A1) TaxID=991905 RepID=F2J2L1_POLGS|nr:C4-dicarboxylate TRAP transporter substrate-binding protein [Polymorphum gilvum]ADZ70925.1 TRAP-type C4-dicarboxylate transport system periplasmic component-like protein [Polymorphum gilvum SL003B-26A1]
MYLKHLFVAAALAGTTLAAPVSAQQAITVNIGSSHPEANIWVWAMKNAFQPEVDRLLAQTGAYKINWVESYGGTLYKFTDTRAAVKDGIVDVGMVGTVWEGASMPLQNVTYFTPFATSNHELLIDIFDKLTDELPELRDSWAAQNMVHLSSLITDSYDIYANFEVKTLADLQNRKINAPGTSANWLRDTGATPIDGALTTYYTNIQTGVSEGALSFASGILPTRVYEVAPHLTRVGIGAMYFGGIAVNKSFFDKLPEDVQTAFRAAGKETSKRHGAYVTEKATSAITAMEAAGLKITELPAEEKQKWVNNLPNIVEPWLQSGGEPARTVLKAYFAALRASGIEPLRAWDAGL